MFVTKPQILMKPLNIRSQIWQIPFWHILAYSFQMYSQYFEKKKKRKKERKKKRQCKTDFHTTVTLQEIPLKKILIK